VGKLGSKSAEKDTADELGMPLSEVKKRVFRARDALRKDPDLRELRGR